VALSIHSLRLTSAQNVTIHGSNFGPSGARAWIGGTFCTQSIWVNHSLCVMRVVMTIPLDLLLQSSSSPYDVGEFADSLLTFRIAHPGS